MASSAADRDRRSLTEQINTSLKFVSAVRRSDATEQLIKKLEADLAGVDPSDAHRYGSVARQLAEAQRTMRDLQRWRNDLRDWTALAVEGDVEMAHEAVAALRTLHAELKAAELDAAMASEEDQGPCFLEVRAGAGGTEACDWAAMLKRMYERWAGKRDFAVETVDETPGGVTGIKSTVVRLSGQRAHGWLKGEAGVHRLVRISPYDALGKRHTTFASVIVLPALADGAGSRVAIPESDLRVDVLRASGAGGQHVNKTESAVRITHIPTGIVAKSQATRSQHQNRKLALAVLQARLARLASAKRSEVEAAVRDEVGEAQFGQQIRSYILHPYKLVKDLRTGHESTDPECVESF